MDPANTTVLRTSSSTRIWIGSVLLLLAVVVGVFLGRWATFSPRPVIAGEIYRSNQPDRRDLLHAKERLGLAAVANLRGSTPDADWYREEVETCCELGLDHRDFNFRATEWPTRSETRRLVAYLLTGPRPLLFHCKAGVDRSGWAAAMTLALTGEPLQDAMGELSWIAGHLCSLKDCVFHRFFVQYETWLREQKRLHDGETFKHWVLQIYSPPPYDAGLKITAAPKANVFPPSAWVEYRVEVRNKSTERWIMSAERDHGIRLGVRVLGPFVKPIEQPIEWFRAQVGPLLDLARAGMQRDEIGPGGVRSLDLAFQLPSEPGRYYLQIDMVDEAVRWFSDFGGPGLILEIEILAGSQLGTP